VTVVLRAAERFESAQPGIVSWHCFSAGAHYDPDRIGVGPLIGVDEHLLAPGAGFASHAHRGVDIVSWVLDGALRHEDDLGQALIVRPGQVLVQCTGSGVRHGETNASASRPLRIIQMTLLGDGSTPKYRCGVPPVELVRGTFAVWTSRGCVDGDVLLAFVASGVWTVADRVLQAGDSICAGRRLAATGEGELLVWQLA